MHGGADGLHLGGDVRGAHQFRDQGAAAGPVPGHVGDVVFLDAADGHEGDGDVGGHPVQIIEAHRGHHVFLGLGGEDGPHADIVGAHGHGGFCLFRAVGGQADAHVGTHQLAHRGQGEIFLPDVHAVGFGQDGKVHMVIHDEAGPGLAGQTAHQAAFFQHLAGFHVFFTILDDLDPGAQQGGDHGLQRTAAGKAGIGQGIDVGLARQDHRHGQLLAPRGGAAFVISDAPATGGADNS